MLRSLVGSEMCIRDRAFEVDAQHLVKVFFRHVQKVGRAEDARVVHQHVDCLLYTSDAADDLLCVDLGGRRIIKKKNNIYTFGVKL